MFDFPLNVTDLNAVPKEFHGLYAKGEDNTYNIHADFTAHIGGLTSALDKERKSRSTFEKLAKGFEKLGLGATPEEAMAALEEMKKQGPKKGESEQQFEERLQKMKLEMDKNYGTQLSEKDKELTSMRATLEEYLIDSEVANIMSSDPELKGSAILAKPHVRSQIKVVNEGGKYLVRVVDKDGDARGDGKGGYMGIKGLLAEMKKQPEFARIFDSTTTPGGGMRPGAPGKTPGGGELTSVQKIARGLNNRT